MTREHGSGRLNTLPRPPDAAPTLLVREFLSDADLQVTLTLLAGHDGQDRAIAHPRIQKPGLLLVGHKHGVVPTRIQILGETEASFLQALDGEAKARAIESFFSPGFSLVVFTCDDKRVLPDLAREADRTSTPFALSSSRSSHTIAALHFVLDERLAPRSVVHGVLVDVFGQGLLLLGPSGIGKSECALELVMRGHRLVADDVVHCDWRPPGIVYGGAAELLRDHIEVRGLGVLNVKSLFGVTAARERKRIHLVIRLEPWADDSQYDRMGIDDRFAEILGVKVREILLPVRPGRSIATILEVAARNELLRLSGVHSAREFFGTLSRSLLGDDGEGVLPPTVPSERPRP